MFGVDFVGKIRAIINAIAAMRGGATTLQDLADEHAAVIDLIDPGPQSITLTAAEQNLIEVTGSSHPYMTPAVDIDWTGSAWAGGETVIVRAYQKVDGTNYRQKYTETFAAAPTNTCTPHPRDASTNIQPKFSYTKQDFKITIQQTVTGAGFFTLNYNRIHGMRGS